MNIDGLSPDLLDDINIPVPELQPLAATNHASVSNSLGSTTVKGADLLEDSDVTENMASHKTY